MVFLPAMRKPSRLFDCVYVHPNHCCGLLDLAGCRVPRVMELTFYWHSLNRPATTADGAQTALYPVEITHPLDGVTVPGQPVVELGPPGVRRLRRLTPEVRPLGSGGISGSSACGG